MSPPSAHKAGVGAFNLLRSCGSDLSLRRRRRSKAHGDALRAVGSRTPPAPFPPSFQPPKRGGGTVIPRRAPKPPFRRPASGAEPKEKREPDHPSRSHGSPSLTVGFTPPPHTGLGLSLDDRFPQNLCGTALAERRRLHPPAGRSPRCGAHSGRGHNRCHLVDLVHLAPPPKRGARSGAVEPSAKARVRRDGSQTLRNSCRLNRPPATEVIARGTEDSGESPPRYSSSP